MNKYRRKALGEISHMMGPIKEDWSWHGGKAAWVLSYSSEFKTFTKKIMECCWWCESKQEGFKKEESAELLIKALFADARVIRKLNSIK